MSILRIGIVCFFICTVAFLYVSSSSNESSIKKGRLTKKGVEAFQGQLDTFFKDQPQSVLKSKLPDTPVSNITLKSIIEKLNKNSANALEEASNIFEITSSNNNDLYKPEILKNTGSMVKKQNNEDEDIDIKLDELREHYEEKILQLRKELISDEEMKMMNEEIPNFSDHIESLVVFSATPIEILSEQKTYILQYLSQTMAYLNNQKIKFIEELKGKISGLSSDKVNESGCEPESNDCNSDKIIKDSNSSFLEHLSVQDINLRKNRLRFMIDNLQILYNRAEILHCKVKESKMASFCNVM